MLLRGRSVLITGGTGYLGSHLAAFLETHQPRRIVIYSRDENKQYQMQRRKPDYMYWLGDIRDQRRLLRAFQGVDVVIHAAALKHVPFGERHPSELVQTNILGTQNICDAARQMGVSLVVALSTDKAVKPVSAMGISKAMMEKTVVAAHRENGPDDQTRFCCARHGNVAGSRGSVIPLFYEWLKEGRPLTVTHARMTRFLMTMAESAALIEYALTYARGGEIFVRKAPSVAISALAHAMAARYGSAQTCVEIDSRMRPGEKLSEVLISGQERNTAAEKGPYFIIPETVTTSECTNLSEDYDSALLPTLSTPEELSYLLDAFEAQNFR